MSWAWVSVVVPTFKRPDLLSRCLSALLAQNFPKDRYEILVADDAFEREDPFASASTRARVEAMGEAAGVRVVYVPVSERHGPAAARNQGWRAAVGDVIAFTDDDTIPDRNWLKEGLALFTEGVFAVSGKTIVPLPPKPTDYELNESGLERGEFITANCFVRRLVLEKLGGFDERFRMAWREDSDLHFRILKLAGQEASIRRANLAVVVHPVRPAGFCVGLKQARKVLYNALLYKKHPEYYRKRIQATPPLRYYGMLALLSGSVACAFLDQRGWAQAFFLGWVLLVLEFTWRRLQKTSRAPTHVLEMLLTSALLAPLAIYWRLYGALKFRVTFF